MNERSKPELERTGATRLDRSDREREIQRRLMLLLPRVRRIAQRTRELTRRLRGAPHVVEFFHQVDDPYSQLALEAIGPLLDHYEIEVRFHLVSQSDREHAPEPELLAAYARRDCAAVAPHYDLPFPEVAERPAREDVERVERMLAGLTNDPRFRDIALPAGRALWQADAPTLEKIAGRTPAASADETRAALEAGNALRARRKHYSGGMFWYAGEWYWGVDRLHHLERRLIKLGVARRGQTRPRFDRPPLDAGRNQNGGRLALEIFPSLRSPYTAMIFERSLALAASVGVPVTIRPVMPMVMRGVPAPTAKGLYIMSDTLREAQAIGAPFGNMFDPIGRPVERALSLWPYARDQGRGAEYLAAFLRAAFAEGRNTGSNDGLRHVVEEAGLSFEQALTHLDSQDWREEIEVNQQTMYDELELWGVPSYRLTGNDGEPDLRVWGQDRLWLIAAEIRRRLA